MPNRYFKRHERKEQIKLALKIKADNGGLPEGSAWTIAKLLDMAVSPNLFSILADMVADHQLNIRVENLGDRGDRRIYMLVDYKQEDEQGREIVMRVGGKVYQERLI